MRYKFSKDDAKEEPLGNQTIEGLLVQGTRTTITIPAGDMGNEMPIQIVSERWYSPDLKVNVISKHSDPRFGETSYQLTRVSRTDQDKSLFVIPADFKIDDSPMRHKIRKRHQN